RRFVALCVPDLVVITTLASWAYRQNDQIENRPPFQAVLFDHATVGKKFLQIASHGPVACRFGCAEIDQQDTGAAARNRNGFWIHDLRSSAISFPSFGKVPGAISFTEPLSFVIE